MNPALIRLLQLVSPALPVGAYTYSQGLEWAVESGRVNSEADALDWIGDCLQFGLLRFEAVYLAHMLTAWEQGDMARLAELDAEFIASRETAELRAETLQMGYSLARLLTDLGGFVAPTQAGFNQPSFPLAWSCAAAAWSIPPHDAIGGYLWGWAENQVMAAVKAIPLGQTAGQRMLLALGEMIAQHAAIAAKLPLDATTNFLPGLAIASCRHETQYTRLFRS